MATNKFKILFIITKSEVGGAQKYVKEQMEVVKENALVYLATNMTGWLTEQTDNFASDVLLDSRIESRLSIGFLNRLTGFIKKHGIELVVCNSANGGLYGRLAAARCRIPSVYVSHGWSSVYNGGKLAFVLNKVEKWLANLGTKVVCVSEADYNVAREKIGIDASRLVLLKNCIFPVAQAGNEMSYQGGKLKLLALARFAHPKRMDLLVESVKGLGFIELHIVGSGPDYSTVREKIEAEHIDNIVLHGEIKSFNDFNSYHAFILLSDSEGLPMSALEAMSAGLPLVMSNVGGCKELVESPKLLVNNDVGAVRTALEDLKTNFTAYQQTIRPFFDRNFNLHQKSGDFLALYYSLIKR